MSVNMSDGKETLPSLTKTNSEGGLLGNSSFHAAHPGEFRQPVSPHLARAGLGTDTSMFGNSNRSSPAIKTTKDISKDGPKSMEQWSASHEDQVDRLLKSMATAAQKNAVAIETRRIQREGMAEIENQKAAEQEKIRKVEIEARERFKWLGSNNMDAAGSTGTSVVTPRQQQVNFRQSKLTSAMPLSSVYNQEQSMFAPVSGTNFRVNPISQENRDQLNLEFDQASMYDEDASPHSTLPRGAILNAVTKKLQCGLFYPEPPSFYSLDGEYEEGRGVKQHCNHSNSMKRVIDKGRKFRQIATYDDKSGNSYVLPIRKGIPEMDLLKNWERVATSEKYVSPASHVNYDLTEMNKHLRSFSSKKRSRSSGPMSVYRCGGNSGEIEERFSKLLDKFDVNKRGNFSLGR